MSRAIFKSKKMEGANQSEQINKLHTGTSTLPIVNEQINKLHTGTSTLPIVNTKVRVYIFINLRDLAFLLYDRSAYSSKQTHTVYFNFLSVKWPLLLYKMVRQNTGESEL